MESRQLSSIVLIVPAISITEGITLVAPFPSILPKTTTVGIFSPGVPFKEFGCINNLLISRMISDAIINGLIQSFGIAAWPPFPITEIYNSSELAIYIPVLKPTLPTSILGNTCKARALSTLGLSKTPASIIKLAPPGKTSSPG